MNERIKELFNQAGGQGAIHPLKYNGTLNVELFAELIWKEAYRQGRNDECAEWQQDFADSQFCGD